MNAFVVAVVLSFVVGITQALESQPTLKLAEYNGKLRLATPRQKRAPTANDYYSACLYVADSTFDAYCIHGVQSFNWGASPVSAGSSLTNSPQTVVKTEAFSATATPGRYTVSVGLSSNNNQDLLPTQIALPGGYNVSSAGMEIGYFENNGIAYTAPLGWSLTSASALIYVNGAFFTAVAISPQSYTASYGLSAIIGFTDLIGLGISGITIVFTVDQVLTTGVAVISTGAVTTLGVTSSPLTSGSVTTAFSLSSGSVTTSPMTSGMITTSPVTSGSVTTAFSLSSGSVTTGQITSARVTTAISITSGSVTTANMPVTTGIRLTTGTVTTSPMTSGDITTSDVPNVTSGQPSVTSGPLTSGRGVVTTGTVVNEATTGSDKDSENVASLLAVSVSACIIAVLFV